MSDQNTISTKRFEGQVAGHDSLLCLGNGLVAKPCVAKERQFYVDALAAKSSALEWIPEYAGDLPSIPAGVDTKNGKLTHCIKMRNVLESLRAPSVMDLKMGTQLHEDGESEAKKQHMMELANATTNGSVGLRVSGARLYAGEHGAGLEVDDASFIKYDKTFGKSLTKDTIYEAFLELTKHVKAKEQRLAVLRSLRALVAKFSAEIAETLDGKFIGSSLLCAFDACPANGKRVEDTVQVSWIDFAHSDLATGSGQRNEQFVFGVHNAIKALDKAISLVERDH